MKPLSHRMRYVLRSIARGKGSTPAALRVSYTTFVALERRKLIQVETTFGSVMYPRTARAWLTDLGKAAIR